MLRVLHRRHLHRLAIHRRLVLGLEGIRGRRVVGVRVPDIRAEGPLRARGEATRPCDSRRNRRPLSQPPQPLLLDQCFGGSGGGDGGGDGGGQPRRGLFPLPPPLYCAHDDHDDPDQQRHHDPGVVQQVGVAGRRGELHAQVPVGDAQEGGGAAKPDVDLQDPGAPL